MEKITHHLHAHKFLEQKDDHTETHKDHILKQVDEDKFQVTPLGMKIVLFNDKLDSANNTNPFYSMFDENNKICGT